MNIPEIKLGDKLVCSICGKEFKVTEDTNCIAGGGYVCGWKCFLKRVSETQVDTKKEKKTKKIE
jgi:hypothetical protein